MEIEETTFTCGKCHQIVTGKELKCPECEKEEEEKEE